MVNKSSLPAVVGVLKQDYSYKSAATQTPDDARLALIRLSGNRTRDSFVRESNSSYAWQRQMVGLNSNHYIMLLESNYKLFCTNYNSVCRGFAVLKAYLKTVNLKHKIYWVKCNYEIQFSSSTDISRE